MTTVATKLTAEQQAGERFDRDTKDHKMTILHDDGLYRHLMFKAPGTGVFWFELITTPHSLTFQGDGTAYTFRRLKDMFQFFRGSAHPPKYPINPGYWAEKVVSQHAPAYRCLKEYSEELFTEQVNDALKEAEDEGHAGVTDQWKLETEGHWPEWDIHSEDGARDALANFTHDKFTFGETWEWELRDWCWWYLWACHAIVWGIAQYDTAMTEAAALATAGQTS